MLRSHQLQVVKGILNFYSILYNPHDGEEVAAFTDFERNCKRSTCAIKISENMANLIDDIGRFDSFS